MDNCGTRSDADWIASKLREAGFKALLAGGCVRDILLGVTPKDFDIATDARPDQIQKIFKKVLMVGAQFGVAMVLRNGRVTECATFRSDGNYADGRRPDSVEFSNAKADAQRRDFTINGMFMDPLTDEIIDYVGGQQDLKNKTIRAIGDANERFSEDFLRVIRAIRFTARLDFKLDRETEAAIIDKRAGLGKISGERIADELCKILSGANYIKALKMIDSLGITAEVFGPAMAEKENYRLAIKRLEHFAPDSSHDEKLACLYAGLGEKTISNICCRWGSSNNLKGLLLCAAKNINTWQEAANWPLHEFKKFISQKYYPSIFKIWLAQQTMQKSETNYCENIAKRLKSIDPQKISPQPFVDGSDLMKMGLSEGPELGKILKKVYDMQLDEVVKDRKQALDEVARLI